jgi:hypothetical protein
MALPSFDEQLELAYKILAQSETFDSKGIVLPDLCFELDSTRTHWNNVQQLLETINRSSELGRSQFINWLRGQLPGDAIEWKSSNISDGIIFHKKYHNVKISIQKLVEKFVRQNVQCESCKHCRTNIFKKSSHTMFKCDQCGMEKHI